jgi:hypothetical protein
MLTTHEVAKNTMKQAAITAACASAITPQQQIFIQGWWQNGWSVQSQVDQQATIAILENRNPYIHLAQIEREFKELAAQWKAERRATSSTSALAMHPAYQQIIGMGESAIPFILADLQRGIDHWFWALRAITRENPVSAESRGNMQEMANAWLEWGHKNGYV